MSADEIESTRPEFEAFFARQFNGSNATRKLARYSETGVYRDMIARIAWRVWKQAKA